MGLPVYNQANLRIERVYFTGTETLQLGQPLCFQESPATASITKGFPFDVELPNSSNRLVFAGVVAPSSVGVTGPAYIDIIIPQKGDVIQVAVSRAADVAVGALLKLNVDLDTTTAQGVSAWDALAAATVVFSTGTISAGAVIQELPALVAALESVASTSANNTKVLAWVRFL